MIWRATDVHDGCQYKIDLCYSLDGRRSLRLRSTQEGTVQDSDLTVVFTSQVVPNDLLRRRDIVSIAEQIPLENGAPFFLDAHGVWLSESESEQFDAGVEWNKMQWDTKSPPLFPPR